MYGVWFPKHKIIYWWNSFLLYMVMRLLWLFPYQMLLQAVTQSELFDELTRPSFYV